MNSHSVIGGYYRYSVTRVASGKTVRGSPQPSRKINSEVIDEQPSFPAGLFGLGLTNFVAKPEAETKIVTTDTINTTTAFTYLLAESVNKF